MPEQNADERPLREQLIELHKKLEEASRHAPDDTDALGHVMTDLFKVAEGKELHPEDSDNLKEQLEGQASEFESRHPRTAGVIREIMDILARLGI